MRKYDNLTIFLKKLVIFSIPVFLAVVISFVVYLAVKSNVDEKLGKMSEYETLIMGDSQMQRINSKYFSSSTKNTASSGEHFYITYQKLKHILTQEHVHVKRIILGVSVHSFAPVYNRMVDFRFPAGKRSWERYLYFLSSFNTHEPFNMDNVPIYNTAVGIYKGPDWGGFYKSEHANPDSATINKTFEMHFSRKKSTGKYCLDQQKYLYRIDSLCETHAIELFLCSTPYHQVYRNNIDSDYFVFFNETMKHFHPEQHINFLTDQPNAEWMSDANHLNVEGAAIYSKKIDRRVH